MSISFTQVLVWILIAAVVGVVGELNCSLAGAHPTASWVQSW